MNGHAAKASPRSTLVDLFRFILASIGPDAGRFLGFCALFALVAGGVKAMAHRQPGSSWRDWLVAAAASSVTGFCVGALLLYIWPEGRELLILPLVGLAGWIGVALLDWASGVALTLLKRKINEKIDE
jgi:hypothetical protein